MKAKTRIPFSKRAFDLLVAGSLLILLSPLFLLVAILIRLESKGPIFYYAYRVGMNYHVFKFYKFRSMYVGAEKILKEELSNKEAQTKLVEKLLGDVKLN